MDIVAKPIEDYMHKITPPRHEVLMEMEKLAAERNFPIIGPLVGRILFQYARILNAKRILELGSGYGYSAFWWGLATPENAQSTVPKVQLKIFVLQWITLNAQA